MARDQVRDDGNNPRADYRPAGTDTRVTTVASLKRTLQEFSEDNLSVWTAALTYTGLLSLFPALTAIALVLTGPVVDAVANPLGIGSTAVTIWNIAKWPVLVLAVLAMIDLLYYTAPNVQLKQRGFRWVTKGALLALVVWVLASAAFALYVSKFGSYNKTYGTLAGVVALLVWLWLTNLPLLLGLELNSERERTIELVDGVPGADQEIQLEPRSEPTPRRTT